MTEQHVVKPSNQRLDKLITKEDMPTIPVYYAPTVVKYFITKSILKAIRQAMMVKKN